MPVVTTDSCMVTACGVGLAEGVCHGLLLGWRFLLKREEQVAKVGHYFQH
ncbi:hypothetical protein [Ktedonobacter sp. SOSP1-52]|nr:hypothetical protein [Ktedonobacter sp. SOSP1-52]